MKFAKFADYTAPAAYSLLVASNRELQAQLVPEWQAKYFDYKHGKKRVKAIARALRNLDNAASSPRAPFSARITPIGDAFQHVRSFSPPATAYRDGSQPAEPNPRHRQTRHPERTLLNGSEETVSGGSYGACSQPGDAPGEQANNNRDLDDYELPAPAMSADDSDHEHQNGGTGADDDSIKIIEATHPVVERQITQSSQRSPDVHDFLLPSSIRPRNGNGRVSVDMKMRRIFGGHENKEIEQAFADLESSESDFKRFLDTELLKIEQFYKQKEQEATEKLDMLKEQLRVMKSARARENPTKKKTTPRPYTKAEAAELDATGYAKASDNKSLWERGANILTPVIPSNMFRISSRKADSGDNPAERSDFSRHEPEIPYRTAKHSLKFAMIEYYRGLELLKAYTDLNRTAFRKINKKHDKVTHARPPFHYLNHYVDKSSFVQSEVIDSHAAVVEDLFSRYVEGGNRKVAVRKLRGKTSRFVDYSSTTFRNGIMLSGGVVLGIQGLVNGFKVLFHSEDPLRTQTAYLLQIYGGYFMILLHFLLFCIDCFIWKKTKINYVFVFEYDTRNVLDWRQLSELPCFFTLLLGLIVFLNFQFISASSVYIYWPVILIGITVLILFLPFPIIYHRARKWWAYSNWRLLLAGLYPVEFRDFFMGDMYSSHTYALGNVALFFCLYGHGWSNPPMCNSNHSRAMGFMATLPSIWRLLQCLRRYWDTRSAFPHLANMGKYTCSLLFYMTLSLYRINRNTKNRALMIVFGCANGFYTTLWDLVMDWSLGNPFCDNPFLRNNLAFRRRWVYYVAMVIDPIIRFNWIFYAIFSHDTQHSAVLSFAVTLAEVFRRGMWVIFRVENEHCTNVERFRASRDLQLPYPIPAQPQRPEPAAPTPRSRHAGPVTSASSSVADAGDDTAVATPATERAASIRSGRPRSLWSVERGEGNGGGGGGGVGASTGFETDLERVDSQGLTRRRSKSPRFRAEDFPGLARVSTLVGEAHRHDFQRRHDDSTAHGRQVIEGYGSSDEDEDEDYDGEDYDSGDGHGGGDHGLRHGRGGVQHSSSSLSNKTSGMRRGRDRRNHES